MALFTASTVTFFLTTAYSRVEEPVGVGIRWAAPISLPFNSGMTYGSLFDATQTMVTPLEGGKSMVQVVSWYDNENSYTSQMVRTIKYLSQLK